MFSGNSTITSPENPNDLCDRMKLLLLEKQTGNNSDKFNVEGIAIFDKLLENKCKSKKQRKVLLINCSN